MIFLEYYLYTRLDRTHYLLSIPELCNEFVTYITILGIYPLYCAGVAHNIGHKVEARAETEKGDKTMKNRHLINSFREAANVFHAKDTYRGHIRGEYVALTGVYCGHGLAGSAFSMRPAKLKRLKRLAKYVNRSE